MQVVPFDVATSFAEDSPLPAGQWQSVVFGTQYPITRMTVSLTVTGALPDDLLFTMGYTLDGQSYGLVTMPSFSSQGICIGEVDVPASSQFKLSIQNTNPANTNAKVSASVLIARSTT